MGGYKTILVNIPTKKHAKIVHLGVRTDKQTDKRTDNQKDTDSGKL